MNVKPTKPQRIGNLRERIILQWPSYEIDEYGGQIPVWHDVGQLNARIEPLGGEERIEAARLTNPFNVRVHIRHRTNINPDWRVVYSDEILTIRAVTNYDERKHYLTLECVGNHFS